MPPLFEANALPLVVISQVLLAGKSWAFHASRAPTALTQGFGHERRIAAATNDLFNAVDVDEHILEKYNSVDDKHAYIG